MFRDKTKEVKVVMVRRTTGSRLTVTLVVEKKEEPRRAALKLQRQKYPDWMVMEVEG